MNRLLSAMSVASALALAGCGGSSPKDSMAAAQQAMAKKDYRGAVVHLKTLISADVNAREARLLLGQALLGANDPASAEVELRKALELHLPMAQVAPELARALLMQGKDQRVIEEFGSMPLTEPAALADVKTSVATAQARRGHRDVADEQLAQALTARPDLPAALLLKARFVAAGGDLDGALKVLDAVTTSHPDLPQAWQTRGELLRARHDYDGASAAFDKAIEARADYLPALIDRVAMALERRDEAGAKKQLESLRKAAPALLQTRFFEAQIAFLEKDYDKALAMVQSIQRVAPDSLRLLTFDAALQLHRNAPVLAEASAAKAVAQAPDSALARKLLAQAHLRQGRAINALADLSRLLDAEKPDADALALAAEAYLQSGDLQNADELYRRATQANPGDTTVRTAAAVARLARGDTAGAFAELESVAKADSSDVANLAIISARMRRGEWDDALKAIAVLEAKAPGKPQAADLAGRIYMSRRQPDKARVEFERAFKIDPLYFAAVVNLARLDLQDKKPDQARARFEELLKRNPKDTQARMALVELKAQNGASAADVSKEWVEVIRADPGALEPRLALVYHHLRTKAPKLALEVAQEAANLFRDRPEALDALGRAQAAAGDLQQSLSTFGNLSKLVPRSAEPALRQADIHALEGRPEAAALALQRALELAPNNVDIYRRLVATAVFMKDWNKGLGYARILQKRLPTVSAGYVLEADVEAARKNWPAAIEDLKRGIAAASRDKSPIATRLHQAYGLSGKLAEADVFGDDWIKRNPTDAGFAARAGEFWLTRQDLVRAERYLNAALAIDVNHASSLNNLAWIRLKQQKPGALDLARKAAAADPRSASIQDTLILALTEAGQTTEALELAKRLYDKQPENPNYGLNLARLYVKSKQPGSARPLLDTLAKLGDKFSGADEVRQLQAALK